MKPLRLILAGAAIGNGNKGVDALGHSVAHAIDVAAPASELSILDDGWGVRREPSGRYDHCKIEMVGVRRSRRLYRPESWTRVRLALIHGGGSNVVAQRFGRADAVLDISGGDSFTDMYGPTRLRTICAPKFAAMQARRPLVLLPQTIGPFTSRHGRKVASRIIRAAALTYARDSQSYDRLLALAGPGVEPSRLRQGVDVAFALAPVAPNGPVRTLFEQCTEEQRLLAGVNVSGLLMTRRAADRFGLAGDYLATMTELVRHLIREGALVILLPHVHVPRGRGESDKIAIDALLSNLNAAERERVVSLPVDLDARELKWCIAHMDWFVGSRMHSTIAGLSSLVPTFGYAYSDKTKGVFATCGMPSHVADARQVTGNDAVLVMLDSFRRRLDTRCELEERVPEINTRALVQLVDLISDGYPTGPCANG